MKSILIILQAVGLGASGSAESVEILLKNGGDPLFKDRRGCTLFDLADGNNFDAAARVIFEHGMTSLKPIVSTKVLQINRPYVIGAAPLVYHKTTAVDEQVNYSQVSLYLSTFV